MKYYQITDTDQDIHYLESKTELSDRAVREEAIERGILTPIDAHSSLVEEISEEDYEDNCF